MPPHNLTAKSIESLSPEKRTDYWDAKVTGLVLRASPTGAKSWGIVYRSDRDGKKQRLSLGRYPAIGLSEARAKALRHLASIAEGDDPARTKRSHANTSTVSDLGAAFVEKYGKRRKRSWAEDERIFERYINPEIGDVKLTKLKRVDVRSVIDKKADEGKLRQAAAILAVLRKALGWAVDQDLIAVSPALGIKSPAPPQRRERYLNDAELHAVLAALPKPAFAQATRDIIMLLALTGQRVAEVCGMVRKEVDLKAATWSLPGSRTKNKRSHLVPLSPPALEIISRAMATAGQEPNAPLFTVTGAPMDPATIRRAVSRSLQILDEKWTPHDLRRSCATGMAEIGVMPHIVEACLNHVSGIRAGVAGVYNRAQHGPEKRRALDTWASHLTALIGKTDSSFVSVPENE